MKRIILALSIVAMASTAFAELGPEISKSTNSPFLGMNYKNGEFVNGIVFDESGKVVKSQPVYWLIEK